MQSRTGALPLVSFPVHAQVRSLQVSVSHFFGLLVGLGRDRCIDINDKYGKKWAAVVGMPLEEGIALATGMKLVNTGFEFKFHRQSDFRIYFFF